MERFVEAPLCDQSHISLSVLVNGTSSLAGRGPAARDGEDVGNGLRERPVDRLAVRQPQIELRGQRYGTFRDAGAATGAFCCIHKTRLLLDTDREISGLAVDALQFGQGENFDVLVAADLDQTRRHGAHCAVVRREGFVELRHDSANGGTALDDIGLDAAVGKIESGLHAANAATNN